MSLQKQHNTYLILKNESIKEQSKEIQRVKSEINKGCG
jgi:hypothetical protein